MVVECTKIKRMRAYNDETTYFDVFRKINGVGRKYSKD